jgi:hypothetical protein
MRIKLVHALDRAATVIGGEDRRCRKFATDILVFKLKADYQNDLMD